VTKHVRNNVILQTEPETEDKTEDQGLSIADNAILEALEMMPFASIRQIAKMTIILARTGLRRFTKSLHFVLKRLRSFPADSQIFKNKLGPSCQRSYAPCLSP
jgi:hypothetical protein